MSFTQGQGQETEGAVDGGQPPVENGFISAPEPSENGTTQQPAQTEENPDSLANPFLANIPELDRQVVAKYIKDWDAGVTRKFQEIHSQYEPYKQLGADPEDLQAAVNIYQQLNSDPKAFYEALADALGEELAEQGQQGTPPQQQINPAFQGLPPEFQAEYQQTRKAVEALAQHILNQENAQKAQQEDAELDNYIKSLREKHGDFDEEFVLTKMYNSNMDGDQAIAAWKQSVQNYINQVGGVQQGSGPKFKPLHGGGSVPNEEAKKITDLSRNETKNLVADIMRQSVEG